MKRLPLLMLLFILLTLPLVAARAQTGGNFDLSWNSVDGGGGAASGGSFELVGSIAQADAGGPLSGGAFELTGGFIQCFTRAPLTDVGISNAGGGNAELSWSAPDAYDVWKSNDPYFVAGDPGSTLDGDEVTSPYTVLGVIGDPAQNFYFQVVGQNGCGNAPPSNRTGEFDFSLVPGSP